MKLLTEREQKKKRLQDKALNTAYILGGRGKSHLQRRESVIAVRKKARGVQVQSSRGLVYSHICPLNLETCSIMSQTSSPGQGGVKMGSSPGFPE